MESMQKKIGPEEVWASIHELTQRQKETDRLIRNTSLEFSELRALLKKTDQQIKDTDQQIKETDKQIKETDRHLKEKFSELKEYVGGIGQNNGDVAESYFYDAIAKTMKIGELDFDIIEKNVKRTNRRQNIEGEYDIILTNSESVAIIEIKYKFHPNDIDKAVNKKIPVFKRLFPEKKDYKLYIVIAGLSMPDDTKKRAFDNGFIILTQGGGQFNLEHDEIKPY